MILCIRSPSTMSRYGRTPLLLLGALAAVAAVGSVTACETSDSYSRRTTTTKQETPEGTTKTTETKTKTVDVTPK